MRKTIDSVDILGVECIWWRGAEKSYYQILATTVEGFTDCYNLILSEPDCMIDNFQILYFSDLYQDCLIMIVQGLSMGLNRRNLKKIFDRCDDMRKGIIQRNEHKKT